MPNDWTIGVEITDIVDVITGKANNSGLMPLIVTKAGAWHGSDITTFSTLSFSAISSSGYLKKGAIYTSSGNFIVVSDNGKMFKLSFSTPSAAPSVDLLYTNPDGIPVSAIAHAEGRSEIVFACNNKIYSIPTSGGTSTERFDTESIISGSKVIDIDYSERGWYLIAQKADHSVATIIVTENWSSNITNNFANDISASPIYEVNYYEHLHGGTWMAGRGDGVVVNTTNIDSWRPAGWIGAPIIATYKNTIFNIASIIDLSAHTVLAMDLQGDVALSPTPYASIENPEFAIDSQGDVTLSITS